MVVEFEEIVCVIEEVFCVWCIWFVFKCGEVVWIFGEEFCKYKDEFGVLVMFEMGKIRSEGFGEV